ncbi:ZBED1 protein, partial [Podargus strigoides]|nr:ZBED1 protein [Podargus strigoides]
GEAPMVFHVGSAWRRKREKGGSQDGVGVDRRKSKVWNFYTKLGDAYVECEVCKKQLSFHNSTTTMREHLVRKHNLLSQLKDDQIPEGDYAAPENVAKRSRHKEARSEVIPELVLEMICQDLHPLSVAKDKGFGFLLGYLEPGFSIPAPARLAGALRQRYAAVKRHLERYLRSAETIVLCVEFWASQPGRNYVTIAATFIDAEWRRARCVLETREEDGEEDLGEKLHVVLSEFGLSGDAVFCVVHDGVAGEPWRLRGWSDLPCTAHALHLCV